MVDTEVATPYETLERRPLVVGDIRRDFPILEELVNGKPVVYLDSTASSLRPEPVIDAMLDYFHKCNANIHRGVYRWNDEATFKYERAHGKVA